MNIRDGQHVVSVVGKKRSGFSYATPKHLAMADATGDSAIVEIQKGKVKIFHGAALVAFHRDSGNETAAQRYAQKLRAISP